MPTAKLHHIGTLSLTDLAALCRRQGRDGLPFPLFEPDHPEAAAATEADTSAFWTWAHAWTDADIWVEARVAHTDPTHSDTRILAYLAGQRGYLGVQRRDEPAVDAYTLSAYDIPTAVAQHVGLTGPGRHPQISVPGYAGRIPGSNQQLPRDPVDDDPGLVLQPLRATRPTLTTIADTDVHATGVVQTRHTPSKCDWGFDWTAPLATWVHINDDGDYLYTPDHRHATPATTKNLTTRITKLINANLTKLRAHGGLSQ